MLRGIRFGSNEFGVKDGRNVQNDRHEKFQDKPR
ncbi:MAG: DUF2292 domain-containing protein [Gammaproteobacteria bacterium]